MSEKTEEPTPKRKRRALEEGDSGASVAFSQSLAFLVAVALAPAAFVALADWAAAALRATLRQAGANVGVMDAGAVVAGITVPVLRFVAPLVVAVGLVGAVATALQAGGVVAFSRLAPKLERLDPIRGLRGLFSSVRALSVLRALVAALAVGFFALRELRAHAADLAVLAGRPELVAATARAIVLGVAKGAVAIGLALGVADLLVTRRAWMKRLRMTKEEVKREHKESEGDPEIRAARQRAHQEMIASASALGVKGASVVVVNPTHVACALRYDEEGGDEAPVVVASGEGYVAQEIVRAARDYGVPIVQNVPLARALVRLEIGDAVPEALYEAVAEVLREILEQAEGS